MKSNKIPTSIDEFEDLGVSIYPNLVAETIYLITNEVIDIIEIFDVTGKKEMALYDRTKNQIDESGLILGKYKIGV